MKWTGTIACALIATAALVSGWRHIRAYRVVGSTRYQLEVCAGALDIVWWGDSETDGHYNGDWDFFIEPRQGAWRLFVFPRGWPFAHEGEYQWTISTPLSLPLLIALLPTLWLWRLERRQPRVGCCRKCNYDLTGNVFGRCPECGEATAPR